MNMREWSITFRIPEIPKNYSNFDTPNQNAINDA